MTLKEISSNHWIDTHLLRIITCMICLVVCMSCGEGGTGNYRQLEEPYLGKLKKNIETDVLKISQIKKGEGTVLDSFSNREKFQKFMVSGKTDVGAPKLLVYYTLAGSRSYSNIDLEQFETVMLGKIKDFMTEERIQFSTVTFWGELNRNTTRIKEYSFSR